MFVFQKNIFTQNARHFIVRLFQGSFFNLTKRKIGFCVWVSGSFGITRKFFESRNLFSFWFKAKLNYFLLRWTEKKMSPAIFINRPALWSTRGYFRNDEIFRKIPEKMTSCSGLIPSSRCGMSKMFEAHTQACNWSRIKTHFARPKVSYHFIQRTLWTLGTRLKFGAYFWVIELPDVIKVRTKFSLQLEIFEAEL